MFSISSTRRFARLWHDCSSDISTGPTIVMAGHSRPKDGVASLTYVRPSTP
jgi:hypothetical protein